DVEDAFQATFLVLIRKAEAIRQRHRLGPWLYGVALRVAKRARHNRSRRRALALPNGDVVAGEPECDSEQRELRSAVRAEVERLPEKYRAPIVLCYLSGLSHGEVAEQLQWPLGTVRTRIARGRDLLRSRLARRGLGPASALVGGMFVERHGRSAAVV